jgi:undecaprenyl-diphosphatase
MEIYQTIILAIVEGLTEFLPISSTAHLIIVQKLLGLETVNEFFTVVIQLGAILAACVIFRKRIWQILSSLISRERKSEFNPNLGYWILLGIFPTLIVGFLLKDYLVNLQNSIYLIAFTTIVFGIFFYLAERYFQNQPKQINIGKISLRNILVVGLFQAISIIPGVSRSGIIISGGLVQKIELKTSIEISFIMGIPIMLIASVFEVFKNSPSLNTQLLTYILLGMLVSFVTAFISIKFIIHLFNSKGFLPFVIYRVLLGIFLLIFRYLFW